MNDFLDRVRSRAAQRRTGRYLGGRLGKSLCFIQGDQNIANQAGAAIRADLNNELQALVTNSQGATAPGTTYRNQFWDDTTANVVKKRNAANSAWIVKATLDEAFVLSRSSNTILALSDIGKTIVCTGSFTQTFTAAATLTDGWWCEIRNSNAAGGGVITLDPNGAETIDGSATLILNPGEAVAVNCNGTSFTTLARQSSYVAVPKGHLFGLTLSNNATITKLDVAAGKCRDSTDVVDIVLTAAITAGLIQTSGVWAAGSTQNKLDTGVRTNSTWYYVHVIRKDSDGTADWLFSLSATAPTMPSGYTFFRRNGAVLTDGAGNITAFLQDGDLFEWVVPVNNVSTTNPTAVAVLATLSIPSLNVVAWISGYLNNGTSQNAALYFSDPAVTDSVPDTSSFFSLVGSTAGAASVTTGEFFIRTNTSKQIRYRLSASGAADVVRVATKGWIDTRGRTA